MKSFKDLVILFEDKLKSNSIFPELPENLYFPCNYMLEEGGKRIRPVLCLMGNELFGEINEDAWQASFAIELFHNFTLIHDDIMDKAPLRRGKPTIHAKYGLTAGILGGDVMSIFAYRHLANIKDSLPKAFQLFNQTATEICEGQQLDMDFETMPNVSVQDYLHMITLKTSVLLGCSLQLGAITGGSLGDNAQRLYNFGKNMGIAFQLMDDYLDAFGDPQKTGKLTGGDIVANKKTFLLIKAIEKANNTQKNEIDYLLQSSHGNKIDKMLSLYSDTKSDKECMTAIKHYSDLAFECFDSVAVPSKRKIPLLELATYLLHRDR